MSLADLMLDQLAIARRGVEEGEEVVPAWCITTPEGTFLVLTKFDENKPEQRERALLLVSRFMTWKMATSFVLTAETWLGPVAAHEALLAIGASYHERLAALQRIHETGSVPRFDMLEWLDADLVEDAYWSLLPSRRSEITVEEIAELAGIFGEDGEMAALRLN
jgi:hypothetical protein